METTYGKLGITFAAGSQLSDEEMLLIIRNEFQRMVALAAKCGVVVTVKQVPLLPLAMGNYETVVLVRMAREKAGA